MLLLLGNHLCIWLMSQGQGKLKPCPLGSRLSVLHQKLECMVSPCPVLPAALRNWKYKDQEIIFNNPASANHPGGKTDPLKEINKMIFLFFSVWSENVPNNSLRQYSWKWYQSQNFSYYSMAVVIFSVAGSGRQISVSLRPAWSSTVPGQVPKLQRILISEKKKKFSLCFSHL